MLVISDETMKLGVNNNVNRESHKASLKLMAGGPSKVIDKLPNSHPSNPIHKQAAEAQGLAGKKKPTQTTITQPTKTATKTATTEPQDTCGHGRACLCRPYCLRLFLRSLSIKKATTARISS